MPAQHIIAYVKSRWSDAVAGYKKFGIHPVIFLAHSAKESGWGTSFLATSCNNYFGMMAAGPFSAYWNGKQYQKSVGSAKWKIYSSPQNSFLDYARLISTSYPEVYQYRNDPDKYAYAISQSRYMTDADGRSKYHTDFVWINKQVGESIAAQNLISSSTISPILAAFGIFLLTKIF